MAKEIDFETRENAEEMYVVDGLTFAQVSQKTGVSETQLKKWAKKEGWRDKRKEYRDALKGIKSNMVKLRQNLIKQAATSLDPQDIYAFVRLENVAAKQSRKQEDGAAQVDRPALFMEAIEFIAETLKGRDPEGLKILAKNFDDLINAFKVKYAQTA